MSRLFVFPLLPGFPQIRHDVGHRVLAHCDMIASPSKHPSRHASFSRLIVCALLATACAAALPTNRTIDDEEGDSVTGLMPQYFPPNGWNVGATCAGCLVHLDPSQTFDGTWHDTTYSPKDLESPSITLRFNGTAVYVYNVLANTVPLTDTLTNISFTLDGTEVGTFVHEPTASTEFDYDIPVYSNPEIPNMEHELVIQAVECGRPVLILFDYIVYTFMEDSSASSASSSSASSISTGIEVSRIPMPLVSL